MVFSVGEERNIRILLLNPNSSAAMTSGMLAAAKHVQSKAVDIETFTAPESAPASINNDEDIKASTSAVLMAGSESLPIADYDAVLVACYSVHTLVTELSVHKHAAVTGIFEASIFSAMSLLSPSSDEEWGIVTTGKFWEDHLADGVCDFLGVNEGTENRRFAGVFSTGLNAGDFHVVSHEEVQAKLKEATRRLLVSGNVTCVVMGCGGMAGLEAAIRSAAAEVYDEARAESMFIVDGVKAGILQLEQAVRSRRSFR